MSRRRSSSPEGLTAVGYLRVSTTEQADSGLGMAAQRSTIEADCARRGWSLVHIYEDAAASGKSTAGRPGLAAALTQLDSGAASALVVAKLDRLSRSVHDAAGLMERGQKKGWALVACDLGVDTTTPAGEAMANVMATFAQLERRMIGQRTRDALDVKRREGVRLGRPVTLPARVCERIVQAHAEGLGWTAIARELNDDGVPTAQGGKRWYPATVRYVALAAERDHEARA